MSFNKLVYMSFSKLIYMSFSKPIAWTTVVWALCRHCVVVHMQFPPNHGYPSQFVHLVRQCLKKDPRQRPTMAHVVQRLGILKNP